MAGAVDNTADLPKHLYAQTVEHLSTPEYLLNVSETHLQHMSKEGVVELITRKNGSAASLTLLSLCFRTG